jgi:hypothetical protein
MNKKQTTVKTEVKEIDIEKFVLGQITKTAHLMKVVLFKDKLKPLLNSKEDYIVGYVGCNKAGMVIGGYKNFAAILNPSYFGFSMKNMEEWSDKKKSDFRKLRDDQIRLNWALANKKIDLQDFDMKNAALDEKLSKLRGTQ